MINLRVIIITIMLNSGLDFRVSMSSKPQQTKAQHITLRDSAQTEVMDRTERGRGWWGGGGMAVE